MSVCIPCFVPRFWTRKWQWNYDRPKQPWNRIVNDEWYMRMGDAITTMIWYLVCRLCDTMRPILYVHFHMLSAGWTQNRFSVHSCGKCINILILNTCKLRLKSQRMLNLFYSVCPEPLGRLLVFFRKWKWRKTVWKLKKFMIGKVIVILS